MFIYCQLHKIVQELHRIKQRSCCCIEQNKTMEQYTIQMNSIDTKQEQDRIECKSIDENSIECNRTNQKQNKIESVRNGVLQNRTESVQNKVQVEMLNIVLLNSTEENKGGIEQSFVE